MQIIHESAAKEFKNSEACTALEYSLGDQDINCAIITLDGRYPTSGRVVNKVCKELVYITKGEGKIEVNGTEHVLETGDMFLIMPGDTYYFEGRLEMLMPCTPAWYPGQHEEVA